MSALAWRKLLSEALLAGAVAGLLFFHLLGLRTVDGTEGMSVRSDWPTLGIAVLVVMVGRVLLGVALRWWQARPATAARKIDYRKYNRLLLAGFVAALVLPLLPPSLGVSSRYVIDVLTLIFTYMILAYGLNLVVGQTGLLDLGYVTFYALGAYTFALLATKLGFSFWQALPVAMLVAVVAALLIGLVVLRLRGDYFAVVTLACAEILRIVLTNWGSLTGGPAGVSGIPRPTLFGISFERTPPEGVHSFAELFHVEYSPVARVIFLYYLALLFAALVYLFTARLRRLPLGRAMEAVREDELAARALGIPVTRTKLAAYMLAAACGALAGAFFAAKQGFISPESFTFSESALVLAMVVLGGAGHPIGIALAALFLAGLPEAFRELQDYRLIAFGAGMVLVMIWRPEGLFSRRQPVVTVKDA